MSADHGSSRFEGLERSCGDLGADWIAAAPAFPGLERIEAGFAGSAFSPHRHDTYAIGVTLHGVQTFRYRGEARFSMPGQVIVIHPDEVHDGAAGTGAGLRYRMLYLEPALLRDGLGGGSMPLPFVTDPVIDDSRMKSVLLAALAHLDEGLEPLFVDGFLAEVGGRLRHLSGRPESVPESPAERAAVLARDFLVENATRVVRSRELEDVTGLDRYALARHFRRLFATSPYRFLMMRRLERARARIESGTPLAAIAAETGFSDQAHLTRHFKRTYGMTPARWGALSRARPVDVEGDPGRKA